MATEKHISSYYDSKLSTNIEKNPDPTLMYIDSSKTIIEPYCQSNKSLFSREN